MSENFKKIWRPCGFIVVHDVIINSHHVSSVKSHVSPIGEIIWDALLPNCQTLSFTVLPSCKKSILRSAALRNSWAVIRSRVHLLASSSKCGDEGEKRGGREVGWSRGIVTSRGIVKSHDLMTSRDPRCQSRDMLGTLLGMICKESGLVGNVLPLSWFSGASFPFSLEQFC